MGISEVLINDALYSLDQRKVSVLYGLPSERPDARDFCISRFDPAVRMSPYLQNLFSGGASSQAIKMAGYVALYIRGSRGEAVFDSIPCGAVNLDEVDKMSSSAVKLARERMSGHMSLLFREVSTPSVPGRGINQTFEKSTQDDYFFKCPHCSRSTQLIFPECLVITADSSRDPSLRDSHIKCKECNHKLEHNEKTTFLANGEWVPKYSNRNIRGFHINQLYSCTLQPWRLAESFLDSASDPADEQTFYNSKLGKEHVVAGAAVTDQHILNCMRPYVNGCTATSPIVTMGIDVGKYFHITILEFKFQPRVLDVNFDSLARILFTTSVLSTSTDASELDTIIHQYNPMHICIDAAPERRLAEAFTRRYYGRAFTVNYVEGIDGKELISTAPNKLNVNRTTWIDQYLGRFMSNLIEIPMNIDEEFKIHIKSLKKMYEKDRFDETIARYVKSEGRTDYAHSGVYAEIALKKAFESGYVKNLKVGT